MTEAGAKKIKPAELDWVAGAPRSISFDDVYFSGDGPAESRHVFLEGNDLPRRLPLARHFVIGELGFGTGLNFLSAWDLQRRLAPATRLEFLSIEKHPLRMADLRRAHGAWPQFAALSAALIEAWPPPIAGIHRIALSRPESSVAEHSVTDHEGAVALTLVFGDAAGALRNLDAAVDAWFLDGFAPAKNPDMWRAEIFSEIARLSRAHATASTFTVAGEVRRALAAAGFFVEKRAGYGRKREMLAARLGDADASARVPRKAPGALSCTGLSRGAPPSYNPVGRNCPRPEKPWFRRRPMSLLPGASVAIVGAGIAGASLAAALADAGLAPTLIDPQGIAGGASGNPAGITMPRLDLGDTASARFFRLAYLHALREIARRDTGPDRFYTACGVLLLAQDEKEQRRHEKILAAGLLPQGWIEQRPNGLFFPQAGVIDPAAFCRRLAAGAELVSTAALAIDDHAEGVSIALANGENRCFEAAIIANGAAALRFREARTLPLAAVMGQIDYWKDLPAPPHAVAFGPYFAPAPKGGLVVGATYEPLEAGKAPEVSRRATDENILAIRRGLAVHLKADQSLPRAAVRCQTPDRMPVVGALPDWDFYGAAYDDLRSGRRQDYPPGETAPLRFILAGLGSRGLVTAPYCAAILAAELTSAPSPAERDVAEALHPARFFIRDLRRAGRRS